METTPEVLKGGEVAAACRHRWVLLADGSWWYCTLCDMRYPEQDRAR